MMSGVLTWRATRVMIALRADGSYYLALTLPQCSIYSIHLSPQVAWILAGKLGLPFNAEHVPDLMEESA